MPRLVYFVYVVRHQIREIEGVQLVSCRCNRAERGMDKIANDSSIVAWWLDAFCLDDLR